MPRVNRRWVRLLIDEPVEITNVYHNLKAVDVWVRVAPHGDKLALEIQFATWKDARFALRVMKRVAKWPATVGDGVAQIKERIKEEAQRETQEQEDRTRIDWEVVDNKVVRKAEASKDARRPKDESGELGKLLEEQAQAVAQAPTEAGR